MEGGSRNGEVGMKEFGSGNERIRKSECGRWKRKKMRRWENERRKREKKEGERVGR